MQFFIGPPPPIPDFSPLEEGWTPLKEPSPLMLQLVATPIGILTGILLAWAWDISSLHIEFGSSVFGIFAPLVYLAAIFGIGFPLLLAVHELIHALGYERFGFTSSTVILFWPSKLLLCAGTFNAYLRNRMLLVYLLPFLIISILPLVICRLTGTNSALLMLASTFNGLCCGGDIFCFFLILAQVPGNAWLRNQGYATYWKQVS